MSNLFRDFSFFNEDISGWDVSNVTNMDSMFRNATEFNQNLNNWANVARVKSMNSMFRGATNFNSDLNNWDTLNVESMDYMFYGAKNFTGDIGLWHTENVTEMGAMFTNAEKFNSNISDWDVGSVTRMVYMFENAISFSQDLSKWCVSHISEEPQNFKVNANFISPNWGASCEPTPTPQEVNCPDDVMMCWDGSYVSRNPDNNCEFFDCPEQPTPTPKNPTPTPKNPTPTPKNPTPTPKEDDVVESPCIEDGDDVNVIDGKYVFGSNEYKTPYTIGTGTFVLKNVPMDHPIFLVNADETKIKMEGTVTTMGPYGTGYTGSKNNRFRGFWNCKLYVCKSWLYGWSR